MIHLWNDGIFVRFVLLFVGAFVLWGLYAKPYHRLDWEKIVLLVVIIASSFGMIGRLSVLHKQIHWNVLIYDKDGIFVEDLSCFDNYFSAIRENGEVKTVSFNKWNIRGRSMYTRNIPIVEEGTFQYGILIGDESWLIDKGCVNVYDKVILGGK